MVSFRSNSYYGWQNRIIYESKNEIIKNVSVYKIAQDSKKYLYCAGSLRTDDQSNLDWVVFRSKNEGVDWEIVDRLDRTSDGADEARSIAIDSNDNIYVAGYEKSSTTDLAVRKSLTGDSGSFFYIDNLPVAQAYDIKIDSTGNVYVVGFEGPTNKWLVRKSSDGTSGSFSTVDSYSAENINDIANCVAIDSAGVVYVGGFEQRAAGGFGKGWLIRNSSDGSSGSFASIDSVSLGGSTADEVFDISINPNGTVFAVGYEGGGGWIARSSSDGSSGSFEYVDNIFPGVAAAKAYGVDFDSSNAVYIFGEDTLGWAGRKSVTGKSGSFFTIDSFSGPGSFTPKDVLIDSDDYIYAIGTARSNKKAFLRKGKLLANSSSLGPRMLATSVGYVQGYGASISGALSESFKLNNVSEFPHSSGIYQMKNIILGTQDSGKVGKTDDSIVQVRFKGSVVRILWPKQDNDDASVKGFGDLAPGQRPGKLSTTFEPGEFFDVSEFNHDHMTLYCYLQKQASGTLDDVEMKVERRPLRNTGFTTDQGIEDSVSGSFTVSRYRDHVHVREIDYGDLAIKEQGWPVDISLENTKEVRISARHRNGQSDDLNKNLLIYGRFVKSEEET